MRSWKALAIGIVVALALAGVILSVPLHPAPRGPYWTGAAGTATANIVSRNFAYAKTDGSGPVAVSARDPRTTLAVLEFGEDGKFAFAPQLGAITEKLKESAPSVVFLYAHGWQNSADPERQWAGDEPRDLAHFDTLLSAVARVEKGRRVFGVYLGWRGQSDLGNFAQWSTLGNRREAARRIGRGEDMRTAVGALVQAARAARAANPGAVIVAVGHSLGAGIWEDYADRALWNAPEGALLDLAQRPDLIVLLDNLETQEHSQPIMERVNHHAAVRAAWQKDRLVTPWIVSVTGEGGMGDRLRHWLGRFVFGSRPGFTEAMLTHDRRNSDLMILPPMADREKILDQALRATLEPVFLAPPRKPWFGRATERAMQYRLLDRGPRSMHSGYWNFRLPEAVQEDAGNVYGVSGLSPVISLLPMAASRHEPPPQELRDLPEWFRADANPAQRRKMLEELEKYCPPSRLDQMLAVQKQTLAIRGEWDQPKGNADDANTQASPTFTEVFTNFDRELLYGSLARLPYNPATTRQLLTALQNVPSEPGPEGQPGPLRPAVSLQDRTQGTWPGDWRRRYAYRIFNILQGSADEAAAWTPENIALLLEILKDKEMQSCLDSSLDGPAKVRFRHMIGYWRREQESATKEN